VAGKAALAEKVGHKSISGELKKQLKYLLNKDLIELTIPAKPTSKSQKYRLTAAGKDFLKHDNG